MEIFLLKFGLITLLAILNDVNGAVGGEIKYSSKQDSKTTVKKRSNLMRWPKAHRCYLPLGMEDGRILDYQITASSSKSAKNGPNRGRLDITGKSGAWSSTNSYGWLQIDLGDVTKVTKVATQGRYDVDEWVKKYRLQYSIDGVHWAYCQDYRSNDKYFSGNTDRNTVMTNTLSPPIYARYVRFVVSESHKRASIRVEVYGCRNVESCSIPLGMEDKRIPDNAITASYYYSSYYPRYGRLNFGSAWCTYTYSGKYLQIDLGEVKTVTKVATQGLHNNLYRTTSYYLEYSIDGLHWAYYRKYDTNVKYFSGNGHAYDSIHTNTLQYSIVARYVRFRPQHYKTWYCLRVELYGCKQECQEPLGVEDMRVKDNEMTSSSHRSSYYSYNARINLRYGWLSGSNNKNQWLRVDLRNVRKVTAVATQGFYAGSYWVTNYKLQYTTNRNNWVYVKENGKTKVFHGNADYKTIVKNSISPAIYAEMIKFHPLRWSSSGISMRVEIYGCRIDNICSLPVGVEDGRVVPGAMTASSVKNSKCSANLGRLNSASAWCPNSSKTNEWLQINLPRLTVIKKIATQGNQAAYHWTTSYRLLYSIEGRYWDQLRNPDGQIRVFDGNSDKSTVVVNDLLRFVVVRYLRIVPLTWHKSPAMRVELYGCHKAHQCTSPLGMENGRIRSSEIKASSRLNAKYDAQFSRIQTKRAEVWCAKANDSNPWLKIDLRIIKTVTKIALQGVTKGWVRSYTLSSGVEEDRWMQYKENGQTKVFLGNYNADSFVIQDINPSIHARYIRIQPTAWHGGICMRTELYGCLVEGIGE